MMTVQFNHKESCLMAGEVPADSMCSACGAIGPSPPKPIRYPFPHCCPVCGGRGQVQIGFYMSSAVGYETGHESCRSCSGTGILWGPEP